MLTTVFREAQGLFPHLSPEEAVARLLKAAKQQVGAEEANL
jgi:hypothetical protein